MRFYLCFGSGSELDPDSIRSVNPVRNPDPDPKKYPQKYNKIKKFHALKCCMFSFEGCSLDVLSGGLGTGNCRQIPKKYNFLYWKLFLIFWSSKPQIRIGFQPKMLDSDPVPYQTNTDPKYWFNLCIFPIYIETSLSLFKCGFFAAEVQAAILCAADILFAQKDHILMKKQGLQNGFYQNSFPKTPSVTSKSQVLFMKLFIPP